VSFLVFQVRHATAASWTSDDPTLESGEFGYETDTGQLKIGDGVTAWTALAYYGGGGGIASVVEGTGIDVDVTDPLNPIVSVEASVLAAIVAAQADATAALADAATAQADATAAIADAATAQAEVDALELVVADMEPNPLPLTWGGGINLHPFIGTTSGARVSLAPTNDRLFYLLGRPIGRVRVSNPTVELVTGAASTMCRVGICEWDAVNGQPGALLVDWGTVNTTSAGTIGSFSNGTATVDLDPDKAYALMFIAGGGTATAFYYAAFAPSSVPVFQPGVSPMIVSLYDNGEGAQRTGGFNNPPSLAAAVVVETSANAPGWRNLFQLTVVPTP